ncbi:MAG TPA: DUF1697 domain-containing protein [Humibacter sp.]|nr:DUF1697 domain-containing protein [Humibacter sp.]
MTRFIALLRGVNVGGRTIKSAELGDVFRSLGYDSVKTVLASGNVVFEAEGEASARRVEIEKSLSDRFGYDAKAHVLETDALASVIDACPFAAREGRHRYVVFFIGAAPGGTETPRTAELDAVARDVLDLALDPELEQTADGGSVIYWAVERGHTLDSVVGKRLGTARGKTLTTNRNLNTLEKLQ